MKLQRLLLKADIEHLLIRMRSRNKRIKELKRLNMKDGRKLKVFREEFGEEK